MWLGRVGLCLLLDDTIDSATPETLDDSIQTDEVGDEIEIEDVLDGTDMAPVPGGDHEWFVELELRRHFESVPFPVSSPTTFGQRPTPEIVARRRRDANGTCAIAELYSSVRGPPGTYVQLMPWDARGPNKAHPVQARLHLARERLTGHDTDGDGYPDPWFQTGDCMLDALTTSCPASDSLSNARLHDRLRGHRTFDATHRITSGTPRSTGRRRARTGSTA